MRFIIKGIACLFLITAWMYIYTETSNVSNTKWLCQINVWMFQHKPLWIRWYIISVHFSNYWLLCPAINQDIICVSHNYYSLYLHWKCLASTYQEFIKYNESMKAFSDSKDIIRRNNILFNYILTDQCDHMQLCDIFWREDDYSFLRYHDDEQKARRWIDLTTIITGTPKKKIRQY